MGIIESSWENLDVSNLLPSFFTWLFGGSLTMTDGSVFGIALVMITGLVSFLTFKGFRYEKAMIPSAFITWLVGFFSLKAGWINNTVFYIVCAYVVVALYYLWDKSSEEQS